MFRTFVEKRSANASRAHAMYLCSAQLRGSNWVTSLPKTAPRAQELMNPLLCLPLAWICKKLASIMSTYITALQTQSSLYAWAPKLNPADWCSNYVWHLLDWWWSLPLGMTRALIGTPKILLDLESNAYTSMLKATKNELHFIMQSSWCKLQCGS